MYIILGCFENRAPGVFCKCLETDEVTEITMEALQ